MQNPIPIKSPKETQDNSWTTVLGDAFRDPVKLLEFLQLDFNKYLSKVDCESKFKMLVPQSYALKMKKGDWNDPLLRQVLPLVQENTDVPGFVADPVGDLQAEISTGLLQKYHGRVLLVTTGACPVHCRYCFRREFPYSNSMPDKKQWKTTLTSIQDDNSISEVIFSGGDPLMIPDYRLQRMCEDIVSIKHVKTLRFHTRVPVFLPERVTENFIDWLGGLDIQKVLVIHANHSNELDDAVGAGLLALKKKGVMLLNQSVLLKGINDTTEILSDLSKRLLSYQVLPYYLHQLDRVQGAAHFEVEKARAIELIKSLRNELPGYLVPNLVQEVSGKRSKQTIV